jgi:arylsulfatase A-like enzyme
MAVEVAQLERSQLIRDRFAKVASEIAVAAWVTALIGALPITVRVGALLDTSTTQTWLSLAAMGLPVSLAVQAVLRAAAPGFESLVPDTALRNQRLAALAFWIALTTAMLGGFAAVLSAVTHHRGLGATTFAIVGLGIACAAAVVSLRTANLLARFVSRPPVPLLLLVVSSLLPVAWVHLALQRAAEGSRPGLTVVADALVYTVLALVASRIRLPVASLRMSVPAALAVTVLTLVSGVPWLARVARSGVEARDQMLLFAPVLDRISTPDAQPRPRRRPAAAAASSGARAAASIAPDPDAAPAVVQPRPHARIDRPDIVLVTLDSVRADHLPFYGYKRATAPHLAELASRAAVFDRAYAAGPETRTALAPLLTGRWLEQCVRDDRPWPTLLRANETLAERLRAQGYATGAVCSFQWLSEERGMAQGFEVFDESPFRRAHPEKGVTGARAVASAIDVYRKLVDKDRPVFLWVHLFDPHQKYVEHDGFDFGRAPVDRYDGEIAYVDGELNRLVEHVSSGPRGDKTVWIVHGSHGEAFGEHGFQGHPAKLYEEVVRVPLVIRLPWASPARVAEAVSVVDIVPTVLDLAKAQGDLPGRSLLELAEGVEGASRRGGVLVSYGGVGKSAPARAWIDGTWKLVVHGRGDGETLKLFDLEADPAEQRDVWSDRRQEGERLRAAMDAFVSAKVREVPPAPAQER